MYFDLDDNRPDTPTIARPLSAREGVLLSIVLHLLFIIAILVTPQLPFIKQLEQQAVEAREREQERLRELEEQRKAARFVFVQPRIDMRAPTPPPVAELSDMDRRRQTVERAPNPTNSLPFSRGTSPERIESAAPAPASPQPAQPEEPAPQPTGEQLKQGLTLPEALSGQPRRAENGNDAKLPGQPTGVIADAIRNVQRYVDKESFGNPQGGADSQLNQSIQFDTKGVEFGPWLRRFVAQIRRNWFVPQAAMTLRGHVVITFNVHKDGRITDLQIVKPSAVEGFNNSAFGAIASSNPTYALPPEYPDDRAFFTVTFYFNEYPQLP
jgi:TonB family protein